MNNGYLSQYFEAVAAKRLSAVETDPETSNQHEFNGSKELKRVIRTEERTEFPARFLWIEEQNQAISEEGTVTWYDARERHATRTEYRLYFPGNAVVNMAREGDTLFIARKTDGTLLIIIASSGSTIEGQLYWLFGISNSAGNSFELSTIEGRDHEIDFATRFILDELGIEIEEPENDRLDALLAPFGKAFPPTSGFSQFARNTFTEHIDPIEDPDTALITYMDWEEKLFRRLERHIVESRLESGFQLDNGNGQDVEGFISFSLSVHNRRKSRAGHAFEDHFTHILGKNDIAFSRKAQTELKSKPDFLFPSIDKYMDPSFPVENLTILGTKTSLKDRWRQVLSEASRIGEKHILTLEPGISENQTNEMKGKNVQLILPKSIHQTYNQSQQEWLMNVKEFIALVRSKQS